MPMSVPVSNTSVKSVSPDPNPLSALAVGRLTVGRIDRTGMPPGLAQSLSFAPICTLPIPVARELPSVCVRKPSVPIRASSQSSRPIRALNGDPNARCTGVLRV